MHSQSVRIVSSAVSIVLLLLAIGFSFVGLFSPAWQVVNIREFRAEHQHGLWWDCVRAERYVELASHNEIPEYAKLNSNQLNICLSSFANNSLVWLHDFLYLSLEIKGVYTRTMLRTLGEQNGQKGVGNLCAAVSGISLAPKRHQQNNADDDELIAMKQNIAKQDGEIRMLRESVMQLDSTLRDTMNEVNKLTSMMQHVVQLVSKSMPLPNTEHTPDNIRCIATNTASASDPIPIRRRNATVENKENIPPTNDKNHRDGQQMRKQSSDRSVLEKLMAKAEKDDDFKNRLVRVYMESAEDNSLAVAAIDYRSRNDCLRDAQNNGCSSRKHGRAMTTTRRSIKIQHEDEVYHCSSASSPVRASAAFSMRVRKFVTDQDQYRRQSQRSLPKVREYADNIDPLDCRDDDDDDDDDEDGDETDDDERYGRNCRQHVNHRQTMPSHRNRYTPAASYRT